MKRKLKRISPLSAGKVFAIVYGCLGLIFAPIFILVTVIGGMAHPHATGPAAGMAAGIGVGMAILFPVFYAIAGFIGGVLCGAIYNLAAKWAGGIEFEVE